MKSTTPLVTFAFALAIASPVAALPINLDFSFGGVTGTFYGLDNSDGTVEASSFDVFAAEDIYTGVDASPAFKNNFTFLGGALTGFSFSAAIGSLNPGKGGIAQLDTFLVDEMSGLTQEYIYTSGNYTDSAGATNFTQAPLTQPPIVSTVPLPAGGLLLLSALAGVAGLNRRKVSWLISV